MTWPKAVENCAPNGKKASLLSLRSSEVIHQKMLMYLTAIIQFSRQSYWVNLNSIIC